MGILQSCTGAAMQQSFLYEALARERTRVRGMRAELNAFKRTWSGAVVAVVRTEGEALPRSTGTPSDSARNRTEANGCWASRPFGTR